MMELYLSTPDGGCRVYDPTNEGGYWYVMQTPRSKALKVKAFLAENSIEAIVPLHYQDVVRRGKTSRELVSALEDLIYIKTDIAQLQWIKRHLPYITYVKSVLDSGKMQKHKIYIENDVVNLFRILERSYQDDIVIVSSDDIVDSDNTYIDVREGVFKGASLFFESVKGIPHKCLTMTLDYDVVIAVRSLTPASFMKQSCVMSQVIDGKMVKTIFPLDKVAN